MSVAENIFLGNSHQPTWSSISALARRARPFLELVGLGEIDPKQSIANLSIGERQLVEVARLMSRQPDVLILDEPTAALGHAESRRIFDWSGGYRKSQARRSSMSATGSTKFLQSPMRSRSSAMAAASRRSRPAR